MSRKIAKYGDSYMKRLRENCSSDLHVSRTVLWFDKGGPCADFMKRDSRLICDARAMYDRMLNLRPVIVFINVSGNDIMSKTKPKEIFDWIVSIVTDLQTAGARAIRKRGDFSGSPDPYLNKAVFDLKCQKINLLVAEHFKEKLVRFSDIRYRKDYLADSVHLLLYCLTTNKSGMKKIGKSYS